MAISERIEYDAMTVLVDGQIGLRRARVIVDGDGSEFARRHHREIVEPGQDVSGYPARVRALCAHIWTPEVIAAYRILRAEREERSRVLGGIVVN